MEEIANAVTHLLRNLTVYEINGLLIVLYALIAQWPLVLSIPCAASILMLDRLLAVQLSLSPRPSGRGEAHLAGKAGVAPTTRITLTLIGLWIVIALAVPQPVPALGLVMWLVTALVAA